MLWLPHLSPACMGPYLKASFWPYCGLFEFRTQPSAYPLWGYHATPSAAIPSCIQVKKSEWRHSRNTLQQKKSDGFSFKGSRESQITVLVLMKCVALHHFQAGKLQMIITYANKDKNRAQSDNQREPGWVLFCFYNPWHVWVLNHIMN